MEINQICENKRIQFSENERNQVDKNEWKLHEICTLLCKNMLVRVTLTIHFLARLIKEFRMENGHFHRNSSQIEN